MNGMTDDGAAFEPRVAEVTAPFRPRVAYVGYRAFGSPDGAVLVDPKIARELRSAAELATAERRIAGGLLYGRGWTDDQGTYLVIEGYLEAGPGENSDDGIRDDGTDDFTLAEADLRLLREDAARMYTAFAEAGWWRTRAALGDFGPQDFATQSWLVGPDGVGLLVYGSGAHWGTAYLGPDGHAPDSAGTLAATEPVAEPPQQEDLPLEQEAAAPTAPPPRARVRRRAAPTATAASRRWSVRSASRDYPGPKNPADVRFVFWALIAVCIAVVVIIAILVTR